MKEETTVTMEERVALLEAYITLLGCRIETLQNTLKNHGIKIAPANQLGTNTGTASI